MVQYYNTSCTAAQLHRYSITGVLVCTSTLSGTRALQLRNAREARGGKKKSSRDEHQTTKTVSFPTLLNGRYIVLLQVNVEY